MQNWFKRLLLCLPAACLNAQAATTYYDLPAGLVDADSATGQHYLNESQYQSAYAPLNKTYVTQKDYYCGIASAVMVLNALQHQYHFTQNNIFTDHVRRYIVSPDSVYRHGTGIEALAKVFKWFGFKAQYVYGKKLSLAHFRQLLKTNLTQKNHYLIAQFSRKSLHEHGIGHISPIAAYDAHSDRVLLDDVASFNYPRAWVKVADLWQAMRYQSRFRGLLQVG